MECRRTQRGSRGAGKSPASLPRACDHHLSIYDAINGIAPTHRPYHVTAAAPAGASAEAAVAAAAYTALHELFTNADVRQTNLLALYNAQLAAIPDGPAKQNGIAWGQTVAQAILQLRANDGWNVATPYAPAGKVGSWRPTPPAMAAALLPGWGNVTPFSMTSGSQFRPIAPPDVNSAAYAFEFNTVKAYGGTVSALRTPDQTEVALFWNDGAGTVTPPGHWNQIAQKVSADRGLTLSENARLFALLNMATADAAISCWDAKFAYDLWRPITAIREAANDGNPATEADPEWTSLIPTPPFPEYTSGHSTFSRGSATILARFFGTDAIAFESTSDGTPGVVRSFSSFSAAANEAGISRLYGGIHWNFANMQSQAAGLRIGDQIMDYFLQPLTALHFSHVSHSPRGTQLEVQGEPSKTYVVRASSDLATWETVAVISSPDGVLRFTDVNAGERQLRFYSVVEQ